MDLTEEEENREEKSEWSYDWVWMEEMMSNQSQVVFEGGEFNWVSPFKSKTHKVIQSGDNEG